MGVRQLAGGHRGDTRRVHLLERRGAPEALSGHGVHRRHEEGLRRPLLWVGGLVEGRAGCIWYRAGQRLGAQVRSVLDPGAQAWHAGYGLTLRRGPEGAALLRQAPFRAEKRRRAAGGRRSRPPQLREKAVQLSRALSVLVVFFFGSDAAGRSWNGHGTAMGRPWYGHGAAMERSCTWILPSCAVSWVASRAAASVFFSFLAPATMGSSHFRSCRVVRPWCFAAWRARLGKRIIAM